jgi:hypothetical protein
MAGREVGWTAALLVEAAEAADDPKRARAALVRSRAAFARVGEAHGLAHVSALEARLRAAPAATGQTL